MPPPFTPSNLTGAFSHCLPCECWLRLSNRGSPFALHSSVSYIRRGTLYDAYGCSFSYGLRFCLAALTDYESPI